MSRVRLLVLFRVPPFSLLLRRMILVLFSKVAGLGLLVVLPGVLVRL